MSSEGWKDRETRDNTDTGWRELWEAEIGRKGPPGTCGWSQLCCHLDFGPSASGWQEDGFLLWEVPGFRHFVTTVTGSSPRPRAQGCAWATEPRESGEPLHHSRVQPGTSGVVSALTGEPTSVSSLVTNSATQTSSRDAGHLTRGGCLSPSGPSPSHAAHPAGLASRPS